MEEPARLSFHGLLWVYIILVLCFILGFNPKRLYHGHNAQLEYFKFRNGKLEHQNYNSVRKSKKRNVTTEMCRKLNGCEYKMDIFRKSMVFFDQKLNSSLTRVKGKRFDMSPKIYKLMKTYLNSKTISNSARTEHPENIQPITGLSSNHFSEFQKNINNADKFFSNKKIVVYDIGLEPYQAFKFQGNLYQQKFIYRKLDFDKYPDHVRELLTFSFKWACIIEGLIEFGAVIWFDTSIVFPGDQYFEPLIKEKMEAKKNPADILFYVRPATHSIASATFKQMLDYIPSNIDNLAENHMMQAGAVMVYNTESLKQNVLKWAYFCILTKLCIAPEKLWNENGHVSELDKWCPKRITNFKRELAHYRVYGADEVLFACHRGDQSMISILVYNYYGTESVDRFVCKFAFVRRLMMN